MKKKLLLFFVMFISPIFCMEESDYERWPQKREFFKAVQQNDIPSLKRLLFNENMNINICEKTDHTALMLAAQNNYNDMARELLCLGANINLKNNFGQTALTLAINQQNSEMVTTLLHNAFDLNIDQQDEEQDTPLICAVKSEDPTIVKIVLDEVPDYFLRNKENQTALQVVEKISDKVVKNKIKQLLICAQPQFNLHKAITLQCKDDIEEYITPDISLKIPSIHRNPLIAAIKTGNLDIVKLLVSKGSCVNQLLRHNITSLMWAVKQRVATIVEFLLAQGADPNAYTALYGGVTPIFTALGNFNVMKLLVENNANINYQISPNIPGRANNITLLMSLVENFEGSLMIPELLQLRADPTLKNSEGQTAIDIVKKKLETAPSELFIECHNAVIALLENAAKGN